MFDLETPLSTFVIRALSQRPDLVASLAKVRVAEDKIKGIKASYFPKISAQANLAMAKRIVSAPVIPSAAVPQLLAAVLPSSCRFSMGP